MKHSRPCFSILSFLLLNQAAWAQKPADSQWIKLTAPGIEVYTDSGEKQGRDLLALLKKAEASGFRAQAPNTADVKPLRVIAFANEEEYVPFRLNAAATGHYLQGGDRDYIVLSDIKPEHYQAAVHEYTHYAVNRAGLHLPLWLNEGIADLYSTVASGPEGQGAGGPLAGRLDTLKRESWLPLDDLLRVPRGSSLYSNVKVAGVFYAESWALAHMLAVDTEFAPRFPEFMDKLNSGSSSAEALFSIYAKTPEQLEAALRKYVLNVRPERSAKERRATEDRDEPQHVSASVTEFESSLVRAELLAAHPSTSSSARQRLLELRRLFPGQPQTEELLGSQAWRSKRLDEAKLYWSQAIEHGSHNSLIIYRYAMLLQESGAPGSQVIPMMERALEEKPDNDEAIYNLAVLQYRDRHYKYASDTLAGLREVPKDRAYPYYSMLAYCRLQMKEFGQAKSLFLTARESARTPDEQAENSRMLQFAKSRMVQFASVRAD